MNFAPKVSFVCAVKNGVQDIERCAKSITNQNFGDIELIFVDDGSDDSTWNMMQELSAKDQRITALLNEGEKGISQSLNIGISQARGDYIARIDVDDFAHANRTELQLQVFWTDDHAALATSCFRVVDDEDYELYCHCPSSNTKILKWSLCFRNNIRHSTVMWPRSLNFFYDPQFKFSQDYELWSRISLKGNVVVVPEILATIKNKRGSVTDKKHEQQELYADLVTQTRFEYYTGKKIEERDSRCLRMIYHLKNQDQLNVLEDMSEIELKNAMLNYCLLADSFFKKEELDQELFIYELTHDIRNTSDNAVQGEKIKQMALEISKESSDLVRKAFEKSLQVGNK